MGKWNGLRAVNGAAVHSHPRQFILADLLADHPRKHERGYPVSKVAVTFEVEPSRLMELVNSVGNPGPFGLRIAKVMATGEISLADMVALCAYGVELKDMKEVPNV